MTENQRANKAKRLRYRRAALALVQHDNLYEELYSIYNECNELDEAARDDERLLDIFDGDTDEIFEFQMMFSDLSNKCDQLLGLLNDIYVTEHFDDFFVGALGNAYSMVGYDSYEEDYYNLTKFEAELAQGVSGKRLMKLTKEKLISVAGQCFGIMMCFLDIQHSYDCLKSVFDLLRDERTELLSNVRTLNDLYSKCHDDPYNHKLQSEYDVVLSMLPGRVWVE